MLFLAVGYKKCEVNGTICSMNREIYETLKVFPKRVD